MGRIGTPTDAKAEVERQVWLAPDLIKIWFVSPGRDLAPQIAWIRAAIAASHAAGVRVVAHATQARVARAVVEAGADILAHSIDEGAIDDGLLAAMRARDVIYIPTLAVGRGCEVGPSRRRWCPLMRQAFTDRVSALGLDG